MDDLKTTWEREATKWASQAEDADNKYTKLVLLVAELVRRNVRPGRSLDIGCGPGLLCEKLYGLGFDVHGVDVSENMLHSTTARMSRRVPDAGSRFRLCSGEDLPFEDVRFDLITAIQLFPYIEQYTPYIRKLSVRLAEGGIVVASSTNRFSLWVLHEVLDRALRIPPHVRTLRNLARTGYHSGGHVDYRRTQQAYCARHFDSLFLAEGFRLIDSMDYYFVRRLDQAPLERTGLGKWFARRLAWQHVGVYQKVGEARGNVTGRPLP